MERVAVRSTCPADRGDARRHGMSPASPLACPKSKTGLSGLGRAVRGLAKLGVESKLQNLFIDSWMGVSKLRESKKAEFGCGR